MFSLRLLIKHLHFRLSDFLELKELVCFQKKINIKLFS